MDSVQEGPVSSNSRSKSFGREIFGFDAQNLRFFFAIGANALRTSFTCEENTNLLGNDIAPSCFNTWLRRCIASLVDIGFLAGIHFPSRNGVSRGSISWSYSVSYFQAAKALFCIEIAIESKDLWISTYNSITFLWKSNPQMKPLPRRWPQSCHTRLNGGCNAEVAVEWTSHTANMKGGFSFEMYLPFLTYPS